MNETYEYESVTEYLMEGNSAELLTEEQLYNYLLEYLDEEVIDLLTEEQRIQIAELFGQLARANAMAAGGAGLKALGTIGGTTFRGVGGGHVVRAVQGMRDRARTATAARLEKAATKHTATAAKYDGSVPGAGNGVKLSNAMTKKREAEAAAAKLKDAPDEKKGGFRKMFIRHATRGLRKRDARVKDDTGKAAPGSPEARSGQYQELLGKRRAELAHTVYARIGSLLGEDGDDTGQEQAIATKIAGPRGLGGPKKSLGTYPRPKTKLTKPESK